MTEPKDKRLTAKEVADITRLPAGLIMILSFKGWFPQPKNKKWRTSEIEDWERTICLIETERGPRKNTD